MSKSKTRTGRYVLILALLVLLGIGVLAWRERSTLLAWFHISLLIHADDHNRADRADRVAQLGADAVPGLLAALHQDQPIGCFNVRAGLAALVRPGGPLGEAGTSELLATLAQDFKRFSRPGQRQVLEMVTDWLHADPDNGASRGLLLTADRLLAAVLNAGAAEVQLAGLELCLVLVEQTPGTEVPSSGRELVRVCLQSSDPDVRVSAIQVGLQAGMDLLETIAGLLHDPAARVRRAALVAVGPTGQDDKGVEDEVLLPCLHDPDPEVRQLCEAVLRGRGRGPEHLELARLLTDPQPAQRMRVLEQMGRAPDLDPNLWLRRISSDPAPSVRAAAIRVMGQQTTVDLTDRLEQMARSDPSPTVCYLAGFYLKVARSLQAGQEVGAMGESPAEGSGSGN